MQTEKYAPLPGGGGEGEYQPMSCGEKILKAGREKGNTFKESGKQKKGKGKNEVERVEYMRKEQKQRQKGGREE
jgi:hypothetical protein